VGAGSSSGGKGGGGLDVPRGEFWHSPYGYSLVTDEEEKAIKLLQSPPDKTADNDPSKWYPRTDR
jgi:hypothetical protein